MEGVTYRLGYFAQLGLQLGELVESSFLYASETRDRAAGTTWKRW